MGKDERLIEEVRVFECLWKVNSKAYKDLRAQFLQQIVAFTLRSSPAEYGTNANTPPGPSLLQTPVG